jgi:hypothetical protein
MCGGELVSPPTSCRLCPSPLQQVVHHSLVHVRSSCEGVATRTQRPALHEHAHRTAREREQGCVARGSKVARATGDKFYGLILFWLINANFCHIFRLRSYDPGNTQPRPILEVKQGSALISSMVGDHIRTERDVVQSFYFFLHISLTVELFDAPHGILFMWVEATRATPHGVIRPQTETCLF